MFLGINTFWALLRAHFNPRLTARAKMSLSRAQIIFMSANINSIVLLVISDLIQVIKEINKRSVSQETVVPRRWGSEPLISVADPGLELRRGGGGGGWFFERVHPKKNS